MEPVLPTLERLQASFPNSASERPQPVALLTDASAEWHLPLGAAASTILYFLASPFRLIPYSERTWEASLHSKPWPQQPIPRRRSSDHHVLLTVQHLL